MRVLFVCTGNSCRSQMAEGWLRHLSEGRIAVESAGLEAHGVNPMAIAAMAEQGVDIRSQTSKTVDEGMLARADLVVTVCDHADAHCPVLPPGVRKQHWPFPDPAKAQGDARAVRQVFRDVCLAIRAAVQAFLADAPVSDRPQP